MPSDQKFPQNLGASRLLTRRDAAVYCAVSVPTFDRICPISPFALVNGNSRLSRFDIRDIDQWIESRKELNDNLALSKNDILDKLS